MGSFPIMAASGLFNLCFHEGCVRYGPRDRAEGGYTTVLSAPGWECSNPRYSIAIDPFLLRSEILAIFWLRGPTSQCDYGLPFIQSTSAIGGSFPSPQTASLRVRVI